MLLFHRYFFTLTFWALNKYALTALLCVCFLALFRKCSRLLVVAPVQLNKSLFNTKHDVHTKMILNKYTGMYTILYAFEYNAQPWILGTLNYKGVDSSTRSCFAGQVFDVYVRENLLQQPLPRLRGYGGPCGHRLAGKSTGTPSDRFGPGDLLRWTFSLPSARWVPDGDGARTVCVPCLPCKRGNHTEIKRHRWQKPVLPGTYRRRRRIVAARWPRPRTWPPVDRSTFSLTATRTADAAINETTSVKRRASATTGRDDDEMYTETRTLEMCRAPFGERTDRILPSSFSPLSSVTPGELLIRVSAARSSYRRPYLT